MLIAAIVALWTTLGSCIVYIRHQAETRLKDLRESFKLTVDDRDKQIVDLVKRIERMEQRVDERDRATGEYIKSLERVVDIVGMQVDALKDKPVPRRSRSGPD